MPDCDSVPIQTVRVYLKRLPSGAYRVTVLSPSLPRPVFRSYPADVGEAEAVARAAGRALEAVKNHINYSACCHSKNDSEEQSLSDFVSDGANMRFCCEQYAPNKHSEHGIGGGQEHQAKIAGVDHLPSPFPRSEQQPADEQRGADNDETAPVERVAHSCDEVMQHGLVPALVGCSTHNADNNASPSQPRIRLSQEKQKVETATEGTKRYSPLTAEQRATEIATQHRRPPLRLRVLWQGLL